MMNDNWYRRRALFSPPSAPRPPRVSRMRRFGQVVWTALKRTCMALGAMLLISAVIGGFISGAAVSEAEPALPSEMVLFLPIDQPLYEHEDMAGPYGFQEKPLTIRDVVRALDHAAADPHVKGLVVEFEGGGLNIAHIEELRAAVKRFREAGKFAYTYATSYDSTGDYYLASAFEKIWLQPVGTVSIPGIHVEIPYGRAALEKIGVQPQVFARKDYKNFFESLTRDDMSPATREMMNSMVEDVGNTMRDEIAANRGISPASFAQLVDEGLFTDKEALKAGLVDRVDYGDVFTSEIKQAVAGDPEAADEDVFAHMATYVKETLHENPIAAAAEPDNKPRVALIYIAGQIVEYADSAAGDLGASEVLVQNIRDAAADDGITAIVIRIDSPGGSPAAAEAIRRAVVKAKEKGKKVIVSMGESAASGGYWVAADADYIYALPGTFTGSIGVTGGKIALQQMWGKLGITWESVSRGRNAGLWSFNRPFSESETARMNAMFDDVYDTFVGIVANGRHMEIAQAEKIARGRVWTGKQAVGIGLVDALGGLDAALDYTAQQEGLKDRNDLKVEVMPPPKTPFEKVLELLETQAAMGTFFRANADIMVAMSETLREIKGLASGSGWAIAR